LREAIADAAGLAELMVFYCEEAAGFSSDLGYQDESYFDALVRMFNQAVATANRLPVGSRDALIPRLEIAGWPRVADVLEGERSIHRAGSDSFRVELSKPSWWSWPVRTGQPRSLR